MTLLRQFAPCGQRRLLSSSGNCALALDGIVCSGDDLYELHLPLLSHIAGRNSTIANGTFSSVNGCFSVSVFDGRYITLKCAQHKRQIQISEKFFHYFVIHDANRRQSCENTPRLATRGLFRPKQFRNGKALLCKLTNRTPLSATSRSLPSIWTRRCLPTSVCCPRASMSAWKSSPRLASCSAPPADAPLPSSKKCLRISRAASLFAPITEPALSTAATISIRAISMWRCISRS